MNHDGAYDRTDAERSSGLTLRATRRGEVLGGTYRLLELIGAGGMAEVYSAEHLRLGRKFAVKVLRAGTSAHSLQRFRRESRAVARIDNEFVVGVIDCGEETDGTPYLVMDLLRGEDLRALLDREGALPIPRAVHFVWEACQGIAAVHALSLIHRDLKPENLFVSKRATGQDWCRVLDFGIAKSDVSSSTTEGALLGTVRYMAPEQLQDAASAGPTVDVYALGAVLYECLSGTFPFQSSTVQELMFKILNEPPSPIEQSRQGVPKGLAHAIAQALAKSPSQRFADVRQFAAAIAPYARSVSGNDPDPRAETVDQAAASAQPSSLRRWVARSYALIGLSGIIGLGVGAALRGPTVSASAAAPTAPTPLVRPVASATVVVATPSAAPSLLPAPLVSPANSSLVQSKTHDGGSAARLPSGPPRVRFDRENPYGR